MSNYASEEDLANLTKLFSEYVGNNNEFKENLINRLLVLEKENKELKERLNNIDNMLNLFGESLSMMSYDPKSMR